MIPFDKYGSTVLKHWPSHFMLRKGKTIEVLNIVSKKHVYIHTGCYFSVPGVQVFAPFFTEVGVRSLTEAGRRFTWDWHQNERRLMQNTIDAVFRNDGFSDGSVQVSYIHLVSGDISDVKYDIFMDFCRAQDEMMMWKLASHRGVESQRGKHDITIGCKK